MNKPTFIIVIFVAYITLVFADRQPVFLRLSKIVNNIERVGQVPYDNVSLNNMSDYLNDLMSTSVEMLTGISHMNQWMQQHGLGNTKAVYHLSQEKTLIQEIGVDLEVIVNLEDEVAFDSKTVNQKLEIVQNVLDYMDRTKIIIAKVEEKISNDLSEEYQIYQNISSQVQKLKVLKKSACDKQNLNNLNQKFYQKIHFANVDELKDMNKTEIVQKINQLYQQFV